VAELDPGVVGGVLPIDLTLVGVGRGLPSGELGIENLEDADAAVQALPGSTLRTRSRRC
jgi:hypothetical protein